MEREKGYTPGPWRMHLSGSDGVYILPNTGDKREDTKYIAIVNGRDLLQDQRNAKLISAAPEMLAALQKLLHIRHILDCGIETGYSEAFDMAERAIEKAIQKL